MPDIIPIGGGKGGVGKSFIAASLGALIAEQGPTVVLIDLDLGASNLHTVLGIRTPATGLGDFLNKQVPELEDAAVSTPIDNLLLISSCQCSVEIANLYYAQKLKLINAIRKLPFDYVLIDLGAGTNFNTLDFFLTTNKGLVICTPEPTSVENCFRFIKAVYLRRIKQIIKQHDFDPIVKASVSDQGKKIFSSSELIKHVEQHDPEKLAELKTRIGKFEFKFLLNQLRRDADAALGRKIQTVCNRHFYSPFEFVGNVRFDEYVHKAVYQKKMFVTHYPESTAAVELKTIAEQISHYAVVEIEQ